MDEVEKENTVLDEKERTSNILRQKIYSTNKLSKGYMYASSQYETEYQTKWETEIIYDNASAVKLVDLGDSLVGDGIEENIVGKSYYTQTIIPKSNLDDILGDKGKAEIYNEKGEKLTELTQKTQASDKGNIVIEYEQGTVHGIQIILTSPQKVGNFIIYNKKKIIAKTGYSRDVLKRFNKIKSSVKAVTSYGEEIKNSSIELEETSTKVELEINNTNWVNSSINENVEIKAILKTDDVSNNLFDNPIIDIELPSEVKNINVKSVELLYDDELVIDKADIGQADNGNKVIRLSLKGKQTKYNIGAPNKGSVIVLNCNIEIDEYALTKDEKTVLKCYNMDTYAQEVKDTSIIAPNGVIAITSIENYNSANDSIVVSNKKTNSGKLDMNSKSKNAIIKMNVLNNTNNTINNVRVIGRIPRKDNKNIQNDDSLGSTFDTDITSRIGSLNGNNDYIKVYYSEKEDAKSDLKDSNNGWVEENLVKDFSKVKSYLVTTDIIQEYGTLDLGYSFEIPANLNYNEAVYSVYTVNYNMNGQEYTQNALPVMLATEAGADVELKLEADIENNADVYEEQVINYKLVATNNGTEKASAKLSFNIPENTTYAEFVKEINVEGKYVKDESVKVKEFDVEIEPGKSVEQTIIAIANNVDEEKDINAVGKISYVVDGENVERVSNSIINKLKKTEIVIRQIPRSSTMGFFGYENEIAVVVEIKNVSGEDLENVYIESFLDEQVELSSAFFINYDEETNSWKNSQEGEIEYKDNRVKYGIGILKNNETRQIGFEFKFTKDKTKDKERNVQIYSKVYGNNTATYVSNEIEYKFKSVKLEIHKELITNENVREGDEIGYLIRIDNKDEISAKVNFEDIIPEGVEVKSIEYGPESDTLSRAFPKDNNISLSLIIKPNISYVVKIYCTALELKDGEKERVIKNTAKIDGEEIDEVISNEVITVIEENEDKNNEDNNEDNNGENNGENNGDNDGDEDEEKHNYKNNSIRGIAWLDENRDGRRDDGEEKLEDISVKIINTSNNQYVTDEEGYEQEVYTDENGEYVIRDLPSGRYMLIFEYDTDEYTTTAFRKDLVSEDRNSDAIESNINDGEDELTVGLTQTLDLTNGSLSNIDIGLVEKIGFSPVIEKSVTKISVTNGKKTKVYNYDNSKLAKVDIDSKTVNNTTIAVEYIIKVRNEGNQSGYVNEIIDNMPSELEFNSSINEDWYNEDEELFNTSLDDILINPGEEKEIKLILTKKLNGSSSGVVENTAEITESYDEDGLEVESETIGNAKLIIGIKTGGVVLYITLSFVIISMIGIGIICIKNKVIRR